MTAAGPAVPIVTIDGPSGSGKGTVSRLVARHTGWHLLDSGALYRLVALSGRRQALEAGDVDGHVRAAGNLAATFGVTAAGAEQVFLPVSQAIAVVVASRTFAAVVVVAVVLRVETHADFPFVRQVVLVAVPGVGDVGAQRV